MAKITAEQFKVAQGWIKFGERLGWQIISCSEEAAKFDVKDHDGLRLSITLQRVMRDDIERTWREQDKPKLDIAG